MISFKKLIAHRFGSSCRLIIFGFLLVPIDIYQRPVVVDSDGEFLKFER